MKHRTGKQDHENFLKSLKIAIEYYKRKYKRFNKTEVFLFITEILMGSASTKSSSTLAILNPSAGIIISSSTALLISEAMLITNENISKIKTRYADLREWIILITLPDERL